MYPFHSAGVAVFLQLFHSFLGMLFFLREQIDLGGIVLQDVCCDAETDACCAASYDVDLWLHNLAKRTLK